MILNNKMTVIVDNTPYNGLSGEWGLSILVEHDGKNILVDAGASDLFNKKKKCDRINRLKRLRWFKK